VSRAGRAARIYVSAGEPSGDAHAAAVVTAIARRLPGATFEAFGGPALAAAGATVRDRMERMSVVGFVEALWKLPAHVRLLGRVRDAFRAGRYDLVILVDYPGYHLRAAAAARAAGIPVLYYIAPQVWAWGVGRVRRLASVNRLAVILPFEEQFFQSRGIPATFVGHPLRDRPPPTLPAPPAPPAAPRASLAPRDAAQLALGLDPARPVLGLFPGSRAQEVVRLWPVFRDAARAVLVERPEVQVVVAATPRGRYDDPGAIRLQLGDPLAVFAAADAGLCKSGTTTLEAALADLPMVIAYRLNPVSFAIAIRLLRVPHVGLVNLIAGREIAPEFLQGAATAAALARAVLPLLDPVSEAARRQRAGLAVVRERLGPPGAADRVARLAVELLG
jgi:lipid-A-disaccharide synthase